MNVPERVEQVAFVMLHLAPEDRERCFRDAFDQVLAKRPDLTEIPPDIVDFIAAVFERIAELEQLPVGRA
jgi:hypothetical protein